MLYKNIQSTMSFYYVYENDHMTVSSLISYLTEIQQKHGDIPVTISALSEDGKSFIVGISSITIDINKIFDTKNSNS